MMIFTPGCVQDGTCGFRGGVNITGTYARDDEEPIFIELYQTNYYDKYDIIYTGYVDAADSGFRPSVTLTASSGQTGLLTVVAQKVEFNLISNSTRGLNGLYEYKPGSTDVGNFQESTVIQSSQRLKSGAQVFALTTQGSTLYAAGNFTSDTSNDGFNYVFAIQDNGPYSLGGKGLNGPILTILASGDNQIYVGGDFTNTEDSTVTGINRVALYDTQSKAWSAMGAGVNGRVVDLVSLTMEISGDKLDVIAVTGNFMEILASDGKPAVAADGFAVWVPSKGDWLARLYTTAAIDGSLVASAAAGNQLLFAGTLEANDMLASGAVSVESNDQLSLKPLPLNFVEPEDKNTTVPSNLATIQKRATPIQKIQGVITGVFYQDSGKDLTIVGGHFSVEGKNGQVDNLAIIDHLAGDDVTGLSGIDSTSIFSALHVHSGILYAGGAISGRVGQVDVSGIVLYDLVDGKMTDYQPPGLRGELVVTAHVMNDPANSPP